MPRLCSVSGCSKPHDARGYCRTHYGRWRRNGDPLIRQNLRKEPLRDRLLARLVETDTGCWEYTGALDSSGYGSIGTGGRGQADRAHRVSWRIHRGPIPRGMLVCHHCDNPPCCNPDHLFVGSPSLNSRDCQDKGRSTGLARASEAAAAKARAATHCKAGHPFDDANTYWYRGYRACRTCRLTSTRRSRAAANTA